MWVYVPSCKWNESGFRPPLCTYRLNWARRTSWGWWDDWDDTVLQTQDSKFEPWRSEAEHATSRSRRLPAILTFTRGWGRNNFCFFQTAETGNWTPDSGVKGSGANHYPRAPARPFLHLWWIPTGTRRCCHVKATSCPIMHVMFPMGSPRWRLCSTYDPAGLDPGDAGFASTAEPRRATLFLIYLRSRWNLKGWGHWCSG